MAFLMLIIFRSKHLTATAMLCLYSARIKMESPDFRRQVGKYERDLNQLAQAIDYVGTRKFPESFLNSKGEPPRLRLLLSLCSYSPR